MKGFDKISIFQLI